MESLFFDWSGTLADDLAPVIRATNLVLDEHGRPGLTREEFQASFRLPFVHFWDHALPGVPLDQIEESYHEHFVDLQDAVELLPGALDVLQYAKQSGIRVFLLSSIKPAHFERQCERLNVRQYFDDVFTGVYDKCEAFPELLARTGSLPGRTLYAGDMIHDIHAARAAEVCAIGVLSGYDSFEKLRTARPDAILESIGDLLPILRRATLAHPVLTVGALIQHPQDANRILLCRSAKWSGKWGMPGGKVQLGETLEQAIRREVTEETGISLAEILPAPPGESVDDPDYLLKRHFVVINYLAKAAESDVSLNDEADVFTWADVREAETMNLNLPTQSLLRHAINSGWLR